ncbi:MAG: hypothetical protein AAF667_01310 [Pseudomonadota bacterium]
MAPPLFRSLVAPTIKDVIGAFCWLNAGANALFPPYKLGGGVGYVVFEDLA